MVPDQSKSSRRFQGVYKGAELIDGVWYFSGMPEASKNASVGYYDNHTITREKLEFIVDALPVFELREKEVKADGSVAYRSPCAMTTPH